MLAPGVVVAVPVRLGPAVVEHVGLVTDRRTERGEPFVLHNSLEWGSAAEHPLPIFAKNAIGPLRVRGHLGALSPEARILRGRALVGRLYDVRFSNCEHFVSEACGLEPSSPQLQTAVKRGALLGASFVAVLGIGISARLARMLP